MFNTERCIMVPSSCRCTFAKNKTLAIIGYVEDYKMTLNKYRVNIVSKIFIVQEIKH
jgi:hypothetical protein